MLTTPHSLAGATIAVLAPNPFISIPLAIGSHFILDSIPHWQETLYPYKPSKDTWLRLPIDAALSIVLVWWIAQAHQNIVTIIWFSAFAANIPDLDSAVIFIPSILKVRIIKTYWDWHCRIQRETSSLVGLIPQIVVCLFSLAISLPSALKF